MPRKFLKRWSPDPVKIRKSRSLRFLGWLLEEPNLFHLNRHSVSTAAFVGLLVCFLPIPGQMPLAALAAFLLRCNLPITFALVWISNPLTFPIIFYACYKLGVWILNIPHGHFTFEPTWQWLTTGFLHIWQPLLLGCLTTGLFLGTSAYLMVNWFWRWHVLDKWARRKGRAAPNKPPRP